MNSTISATPEILASYCGPIEWALLDAAGPTTWRRGVWGPVGPSSGPEELGVVRAGDMRGDLAIRLSLLHPVAACHAKHCLAAHLGAPAAVDVSLWRLRDPSGQNLWSKRLCPWDLVADGRHLAMFVDGDVSAHAFKRGFSIPGLADMSYPEVLASACVAAGVAV